MSTDVKNWSANQRKFIEWLSLPTRQREPFSQGMLAAELGVAEATLSRWKHLEGFDDEVQATIRRNLGDVLNEVVGSFKDEAKKGQFQHQKMYFEMLGWYVERRKIDLDVRKLSDEELLAIIEAEG